MSEAALMRIARKLGTRNTLTEDDIAEILALPVTLRDTQTSDYLVREGEAPKNCSYIIRGFAYRQKVTGFGARQILSIHMPGDILDVPNLFLEISDHNVQMMTRGQVAIIPRAALRRLALGNAAIARAMWIDSLIEGATFREWILNVGRRDARARIAHLLCEFATRFRSAGLTLDDGNAYELPMTQEQIGDAAGLTPVHVNRTLKILAEQGLITRDRRFVTIEDWDALVSVADFSPRYLHLDQLDDDADDDFQSRRG